MEKMTVEITQTKLGARKRTTRARRVSLLATMGNASTIILFATKSLIVLMILM